MAVLGSCSDVMLHRVSRVACVQECVILVPVSTVSCMDMARLSRSSGSSRLCEMNLRFRFQQGRSHSHRALRQFRRLNASLGSPNDSADAAGGSDDGKEQEVPANSLEFTHKVALDVLAPPDLVWKLWTDIKSAPLWMRWIDRVDFLDDDSITDSSQDLPLGLSRLSRWICSTIGFEVMWVARVEHVESNLPVRVLRWATVEGLPSRGAVTFKENNTKGTTVELSISHSLPTALGRVMQSSALRGLVQATLQTDLECFQKARQQVHHLAAAIFRRILNSGILFALEESDDLMYAAEAVSQQRECVNTEEVGVTERKGSLTITTDCSQNLCEPL